MEGGHWHFDRALTAANIDPPPIIIPVLDPLPVHPRGRPEGALKSERSRLGERQEK